MKRVLSFLLLLFLVAAGNAGPAHAQLAGHCDFELRKNPYTLMIPESSARSFNIDTDDYPDGIVKVSFYLDPAYQSSSYEIRVLNKDMQILTSGESGNLKPAGDPVNANSKLARYEADVRLAGYPAGAGNLDTINVELVQSNGGAGTVTCGPVALNKDLPSCTISGVVADSSSITVSVDGTKLPFANDKYTLEFNPSKNINNNASFQGQTKQDIKVTHNVVPSNQSYTVSVKGQNFNGPICSGTFVIPPPGGGPIISSGSANLATGKYDLCAQVPATLQSKCTACESGSPKGIWTAVGCIKSTPENIVKSMLQIGLSIAGGVALLMILAAGFLFSVSQGDPKRTTEARELLSSAVIGLLFIIFSVTILQFIGITLLHIPGFGT